MPEIRNAILHITEKALTGAASAITSAHALIPEGETEFKQIDLPQAEILKLTSHFMKEYDFSKDEEEISTVTEMVKCKILNHFMKRHGLTLVSEGKEENKTSGDTKVIRHIYYLKKEV